VQPSFQREFGLDKLNLGQSNAVSSNIVSVFQGGCFFGALFALPLSERFGRRYPILGSAALFVLGSFLQIWSNGRLNLIYVGRVLNGLGVGIASCLVPVYIAEFSPPAIRGRLVGIYEIMYQIAALIG
jgi:MFS family permease